MQVDGLPAANVSLNRLRAMLRDPTRTVTLSVRRGEHTKSVALVPREFRGGRALEAPAEDAAVQADR